jgi:benzoylformate decarboxylase
MSTQNPHAGGRLGAQAFLEQLIACDVEVIFGNPGTTEQTVIDYLQRYPELELVLALHEGVAVGAADGYARVTGKVGVVELHAGPGLGNGIGNLYNAFIGHTPMLVYVGQSEQRSLYQEPVLTADMVALASPVTKWAYEIRTADEIPQVVRRAIKVATTPPYGPVLLSIPVDLTDAWTSAPVVPQATVAARVRPDRRALQEAAELLREAQRPLILVGDAVATSDAIDAVSQLAGLLGAPILEGAAFETVADQDDTLYAGRLPGDPAAADRALEGYDAVVAIGTRVLAQVFPRPGAPLGRRTVVHIGTDPWELAKSQPSLVVLGDEREATLELTEALRADALPGWSARAEGERDRIRERRDAVLAADRERWDDLPMTPQRALFELAAALPDDVCVIDEAMSSYESAARHLPRRRGAWFRGAGGIGMGLPRAVGATYADRGRPVVAVVGDGASMYSLTALWTAAHHDLPTVWVVLANRSYRTLKQNTVKSRQEGAAEHDFVGADLTEPIVDFTSIAAGFGVRAWRAERPDELKTAMAEALACGGPALVELIVSGDL